MASRFYPISREEIHQFLADLGFVPLSLKGVIELVYGKIVQPDRHRLSLRIYTAVNSPGESREKGTDAIRLQLFHKVRIGNREEILPVGRAQKCLRVASWQANLQRAIARIGSPENSRICPACGNLMVLRENRDIGEEFWGCCLYRYTGCRGRRQAVARPNHPTIPAAAGR